MTNKELAVLYYDAMTSCGCFEDDNGCHTRIKESIEGASFDIDLFFQNNGSSLSKMNIKGIGKGTKEILELALSLSLEDFIEKVSCIKNDKLHKKLDQQKREFEDVCPLFPSINNCDGIDEDPLGLELGW